MPFIVIYDANVLYPNSLRDLLIRVAQAGLVQAKWTDQILDETFRHLKENRPDLDPAKLDRTRELMNKAIRDALVTGYEPLIEVLDLPDPDDRHVLAAAIKATAQVIVTENTKDFPPEKLASWNIEAQAADDFGPLGWPWDQTWCALLALYVSGGARANELLGMDGEHVDWGAQRALVVSKGTRTLDRRCTSTSTARPGPGNRSGGRSAVSRAAADVLGDAEGVAACQREARHLTTWRVALPFVRG